MNVTREVIYDLLPGYFADEVSADTRTLVEEFFTTDPDFKRMVERFGALLERERREPPPSAIDADREKQTFDQIRARIKLRHAAIVWAVSALMALGLMLVARAAPGNRNPGVVIGVVFGAMAVWTWLASISRRRGYWYAEFLGGRADESRAVRDRRRLGR